MNDHLLLMTLERAGRDQMLSVSELNLRGFTSLEIEAAAERGDVVISDRNTASFASVILTVDGQDKLASRRVS